MTPQSTNDSVPASKPGRYFFLLLCSFLILVIVPVGVFGFLVQRSFSRILVSETEDYSERILGYVSRTIDEELLTVEKDLLTIDLNSGYRALVGEIEPDDPATLFHSRVLQEQLAQIVGNNDILHSVVLYFPGLDRVLTNATTARLARHPDRELIEAVTRGVFREGDATVTEVGAQSVQHSVYVITRARPYGVEHPRAIILANLDPDHIVDRLREFQPVGQARFVVTDDSQATIFSTTEDHGEDHVDDQAAVRFVQRSSLRDWAYEIALPAGYIRARSRPVRVLVIQLAAILMVLGVGMSYGLSRMLYSPVQHVLREISRMDDTRDGGKRNEFALIDEAMHQVLDSNEYLSRLLELHEQSIQNSVFRRMLEGVFVPPEVLQSSLSLIGFPENWLRVAVDIVEVDATEPGDSSSERAFFRRLGIAEIAKRQGEAAGYQIFPLLLENRRVHLIVVIDKHDLVRVAARRELSSAIQAAVRSELELVASVGLGTAEDRLHLLRHSNELAQKSLQGKFYRGGGAVFSAEETRSRDELIFPYSATEIQKINHHLTAGTEEDLSAAIHAMFEELTANTRCPPSVIRAAVMQLVSATATTLSEHGFAMGEFVNVQTPIPEFIASIDSIGQLERWLNELYIRVNASIRRRADEYSSVVRGALALVHERYAEPISISLIADHLGMTQQYVSKRFKEEIGVNYVDYLNRYRLERAREQLEETDATVREVGESVGFANPQYFIKRFRERYGVTPAQYRAPRQRSARFPRAAG